MVCRASTSFKRKAVSHAITIYEKAEGTETEAGVSVSVSVSVNASTRSSPTALTEEESIVVIEQLLEMILGSEFSVSCHSRSCPSLYRLLPVPSSVLGCLGLR